MERSATIRSSVRDLQEIEIRAGALARPARPPALVALRLTVDPMRLDVREHFRGVEAEWSSLTITDPDGAQLVLVVVDPFALNAKQPANVIDLDETQAAEPRRVFAQQLDHTHHDRIDVPRIQHPLTLRP